MRVTAYLLMQILLPLAVEMKYSESSSPTLAWLLCPHVGPVRIDIHADSHSITLGHGQSLRSPALGDHERARTRSPETRLHALLPMRVRRDVISS